MISPVRSAKGLEGKLLRTHGRIDDRPPTSLGASSGAPRVRRPRLLQHQHTTSNMATEASPPVEIPQDAPREPSADAVQKPPVKRSWR